MRHDYICEFVTLAENCSFQQTAAEMFVSESVLSKHIKALEEELGVLLFDRKSRKVFLSKYGKAFYPYAKEMVGQFDAFQVCLSNMKRQESSQLSIGMQAHMSSYGVYSLISKFKQSVPGIDVIVHEGKDYEQIKLLQAGDVDFIFSTSPPAFSGYKQKLYKRDHLVITMSNEHALAKSEYVTVEQLNKEHIIVHEPQFDYDPFWHLCHAEGFVPQIKARIYFHSAIIKLIELNEGIAVMGGVHAAEHARSSISIIPVFPKIPFDAYVIYDDKREISSNAKKFLEFLAGEADFDHADEA